MLPEVRMARIVDAIGRYRSGVLSCVEAGEVSYFLSKLDLHIGKEPGLSAWRKRLFLATSQLTADAAEYFGLPRDRVVIMGTKPGRIVRVVTPGFERQGRIDIMRSEGFHKLADELTAAIDPEG